MSRYHLDEVEREPALEMICNVAEGPVYVGGKGISKL